MSPSRSSAANLSRVTRQHEPGGGSTTRPDGSVIA
jgi:hypothetical protein